MAKDYTNLTKAVIGKIGGKENVDSVKHCATRLRFVVKDESKVQVEELKQIQGVIDLIVASGQYQVVIGAHVSDVYKKTCELYGFQSEHSNEEKAEKGKKGFANILDTISSIFIPILYALCGAGILKGFLVTFTAVGWLSAESGTYTVLYAAADSIFYFLPLALAFTSATKFGADKFISLSIAGAMIYPNILNAYNAGEAISFLGIPVVLINYTSSVIPIIASVFALSKLEAFLKKVLPGLIRTIMLPLLSLTIMVPVSLLVIGPISDTAGNALASVYTFLYTLSPPIAGFVIALIWPIVIVLGLHWGMLPVIMNNYTVYGYDTLAPATVGLNFAQGGAALGVFLKTKDTGLKATAFSAAVSVCVGGISEPALYGVTMKYKKSLYISLIFTAIGGAVVGLAGGQFPGFIGASILTLPAIASFKGGIAMLVACAIGFVGTAVCTYFFGFDDSMIKNE